MTRRTQSICFTAVALALLIFCLACSGGGASKGSSSPATINVSVSDPTTCSAAVSGPYSSILIAITDVQIHTSSTAGDNDPNWIDLTPSLKQSGVPKQVDLLGIRDNQCFLAMLGSNTAIQPGTYQQIRIFLADNTTANANTVVGNKCGANAVNCVILAPPNSATPQPLQVSGEVRTGIKIPSGQIAGGQFTIASGQTKDLNIDIDSCASIVVDRGNGSFRLKPVLHAGEVSATSVSINGKLMDNVTKQPISGGKAIVALEQKDANGVDRVIMETTTDAAGQFDFCPVSAGTYDVVAVAVNGSGVAYAATITTGVQPGNALGNIPMNPATGTNTTAASIQGNITAVNANNNGTAVDVLLSAIEQVTVGSSTLQFTIPVATPSATVLVSVPATGCATNPCYTLTPVPPVNPTLGAFTTAPTGVTYTAGTGNATYVIEGQSFVPLSGGQTTCTAPGKLTTNPVSVSAGNTATASTMAFTGCL